MILDKFPTTKEFYETYWGKKPFIVRKYIDQNLIDCLVDGDTMAGLSLEEDIKSRIVTNDSTGKKWECEHGPFDESRFSELGDRNWSLLVQNVEQYHTDTAQLLKHFHFSPRWLLDDIMVSYSAPGGSVGPHTDSYHTFLVQGMGVREWKISSAPVTDNNYIKDMDVKVLQNGFAGETFEVRAGDVIYLPPHIGHEGVTKETAMTFSVGFLGPKTSEMMSEYAAYLEENEKLDSRYLGEDLSYDSAAFSVSTPNQNTIRSVLLEVFEGDGFYLWLAEYLSSSTHIGIDDIEPIDEPFDGADMLVELKQGGVLNREEYVKLSITQSSDGVLNLAVYGEVVSSDRVNNNVVEALNLNEAISFSNIESSADQNLNVALLTRLYNMGVLSF